MFVCVEQGEAARREALMMSKLHRCMQYAKRERNIDLFLYFERLYEDEQQTDHMFVGVHEMCTLTCKKPCPPGSHLTCRAAEFMSAYNDFKVCVCVCVRFLVCVSPCVCLCPPVSVRLSSCLCVCGCACVCVCVCVCPPVPVGDDGGQVPGAHPREP